MSLSVVRWASWEEAEKLPLKCEWMGGWFGFRERGQRWKDYLTMFVDEGSGTMAPYVEAVREKVLADGLRKCGGWHQEKGCPVFSDGTTMMLSMRAWGDLMAAIWSEKENRDYHYMHFYYCAAPDCPDEHPWYPSPADTPQSEVN